MAAEKNRAAELEKHDDEDDNDPNRVLSTAAFFRKDAALEDLGEDAVDIRRNMIVGAGISRELVRLWIFPLL